MSNDVTDDDQGSLFPELPLPEQGTVTAEALARSATNSSSMHPSACRNCAGSKVVVELFPTGGRNVPCPVCCKQEV